MRLNNPDSIYHNRFVFVVRRVDQVVILSLVSQPGICFAAKVDCLELDFSV